MALVTQADRNTLAGWLARDKVRKSCRGSQVTLTLVLPQLMVSEYQDYQALSPRKVLQSLVLTFLHISEENPSQAQRLTLLLWF